MDRWTLWFQLTASVARTRERWLCIQSDSDGINVLVEHASSKDDLPVATASHYPSMAEHVDQPVFIQRSNLFLYTHSFSTCFYASVCTAYYRPHVVDTAKDAH